MTDSGFTSQQVMGITGLSQRQLAYWRKTGLVVPGQLTTGGHARYSFTDLVALKTAKKLIDAGVSVQRIRKSIASLTAFLPACESPLSELALVATGDMVLVLHRDSIFEALTGQEWILPVAELAREAALWRGEAAPEQGDLFQSAEPTQGDSGTNGRARGRRATFR